MRIATLLHDKERRTYSVADINSTDTNATDIATIAGSATQLIRVTKIRFSATLATLAVNNVFLIKRSTANTGGTSNARVGIPHDSGSVAATATVRTYTVNPTALGTKVGTFMRIDKILMPTATSVADADRVEWVFGDTGQEGELRGTAELLCVNLNAAVSGASCAITFEWTEE